MSSLSLNDLKKRLATNSGDIPESVVELPSNKQKATIRPMKVKEQKSILKAIEKRNEYLVNESFDILLDKCVISVDGEPFDNDDIILQDRKFLLIKIQELTNGPKSKIQHINHKTGDLIKDVEVDISELDVIYFEGELYKEIQLSDTLFINVGPITRKGEKEIERWTKKNKAEDSVIDKRYCGYASLIKRIIVKDDEVTEYNLSFDEKVQFISDNCSSSQLKEIDKYVKTLDFGIQLKVDINTEEYTSEEEEDISIISFFIN